MKTKAAILFKTNKPVRIESITIPELKTGQVLVKIAYSGICHSQLNEIRGEKGKDMWLPHTLGHEGSGVVISTGSGVTKVNKGDKVILTWIKASGLDAEKIFYKHGNNLINSGPISTFSEYAVVSENRLVPLCADIPMDVASLLGCAVPTGAGMVLNTILLSAKSSIGILGVGGVGMSAVMGAGIRNCGKIVSMDIKDDKLKLSKEIGATHTINTRKKDIYKAIMEITGNIGLDFIIEAAGSVKTMEIAPKLIHNKGTVVIAGNVSKGKTIRIDPFDFIKGKKIVGTWGGETKPDIDLPYYTNLYKEGKLNLKKLISREYRLEDINTAFLDLENGKIKGRCIIKM